jgi:hypothetical protein
VPKLEVPWWDIEAGEWRVATLPARTIEVAAVDVPPPPPVDEPVDAPDEIAQSAAQPAPDGFWRRVAELIAGAWFLTLLAWWWSSVGQKKEPKEPAPPPIYKQQAKFVKAAKKAASEGDKAGVRRAVIEWGRLQWPDDAPRSIGDMANRVASPLSNELRALSASSYSNGAVGWDGSSLASALRSINVLIEDGEATTASPLPPLMPPSLS